MDAVVVARMAFVVVSKFLLESEQKKKKKKKKENLGKKCTHFLLLVSYPKIRVQKEEHQIWDQKELSDHLGKISKWGRIRS